MLCVGFVWGPRKSKERALFSSLDSGPSLGLWAVEFPSGFYPFHKRYSRGRNVTSSVMTSERCIDVIFSCKTFWLCHVCAEVVTLSATCRRGSGGPAPSEAASLACAVLACMVPRVFLVHLADGCLHGLQMGSPRHVGSGGQLQVAGRWTGQGRGCPGPFGECGLEERADVFAAVSLSTSCVPEMALGMGCPRVLCDPGATAWPRRPCPLWSSPGWCLS